VRRGEERRGGKLRTAHRRPTDPRERGRERDGEGEIERSLLTELSETQQKSERPSLAAQSGASSGRRSTSVETPTHRSRPTRPRETPTAYRQLISIIHGLHRTRIAFICVEITPPSWARGRAPARRGRSVNGKGVAGSPARTFSPSGLISSTLSDPSISLSDTQHVPRRPPAAEADPTTRADPEVHRLAKSHRFIALLTNKRPTGLAHRDETGAGQGGVP
jgi:hypothetical protein